MFVRVLMFCNKVLYVMCIASFTALHEMQMRSSDENSVCPSHAWIVTKQ